MGLWLKEEKKKKKVDVTVLWGIWREDVKSKLLIKLSPQRVIWGTPFAFVPVSTDSRPNDSEHGKHSQLRYGDISISRMLREYPQHYSTVSYCLG